MAQDTTIVDAARETAGSDLIGRIQARTRDIRELGASGLFVYGSRARNDARVDSDLDVAVDYDCDSRFSLVKLAGIKRILEEATGLPVHITTVNSIPSASADAVLGQAIRIF